MLKISEHPLLQTTHIAKVIREFDFVKDDFVLSSEIPVREIDQDQIAVDVRKGAGGMTQAAKAGAESPTVGFYGVNQYKFRPAEWREKVILTTEEMYHLRKLGTNEDVESVQEIISRHLADLRMRLENRLEWCRWQALFGSLTHTASDVSYSVDYKIPSDLKPTLTGGDLWTAGTSDPMDDILEWVEKYRDLVAKPVGFWFNHKTLRVAMQSSKVRDLRDTLFSGQANLGNLTPQNLQAVFNHYAGLPYTVYDGGYFEQTDLTAGVASSGTTLNVRDVGTVAVGDSVTLTDVAGDITGRVKLAVTAVSASAKTITVSAPGTDRAYPAGSSVRVKKFFIPDGKFIVKGELPNTIEGGSQWAEIISTTHPYGPNPLVPAKGIFAKTVVHETSDPPKVEIIVGMNGLPVVYHRDVNVIASVY
jgi:hypothetical protein